MIKTQKHFLASIGNDMQDIEEKMNQLSSSINQIPVDQGRWEAVFWAVLYLLIWIILMPFFISHGPLVFIGYMISYWLLAIYLLAWDSYDFRYWKIKKAVAKYKIEKERIARIYSSVISDMNMDFRDKIIVPQKIIDIEKWISYFSNEIKTLYQNYRNILFTENEVRVIANPRMLKPYKDFLIQEWIWLTECITSFSRDLDTWITRHHSELLELKNSVDTQAKNTNSIEWKAALGLTEERISKLSEEIFIH